MKPALVQHTSPCGKTNQQGEASNDLKEHEDRKCRLQQLASRSFKANPKFYEYLVKKTEVAALPSDISVLRVVFEERVFFDTARWDILQEASAILDIVAESLRKEPAGTALFVAGHTDARGSDLYNFDLSVKRANSVAEALVQRTVGPVKIWRVGFGKAIPLRANDTSENMAVNRRVESIMASRFDAVVHTINKLGKYLCSEGDEALPEFCKDPTAVPQVFEAKVVNPPNNEIALEAESLKIPVPPPDQFEITLMPPPLIEIGPPLQ